MNYSVTGYNPYIDYGYYPLNNRVAARNVTFTSQPDTVSLSSNNQTQSTKTGLSKNAKLGLGALALVGIGAAAYILSRGKVGSKSAQQLAEHIEFKKAANIQEAKQFAAEKLGVTLNLEDLEVANYVNEGLVRVSNKLKGKSSMPKVVDLADYSGSKDNPFMSWQHGTCKLRLKQQITNLADSARKKNISLAEYIESFMFKDNRYTNKGYSPFHWISHELGHANHFATCSDAGKMVSIKKLQNRGITDMHYTEEFLKEINAPEIQALYDRTFVSNYPKTSPAEFVADTFGRQIDGASIPKELLDIYRKYGGPALS